MQEKLVRYGEFHDVKVLSAGKHIIIVHAEDINEAFCLLGHGVKNLPAVDEKGKIVFVEDERRGHWKWIAETL
jgi:hypothetical protein